MPSVYYVLTLELCFVMLLSLASSTSGIVPTDRGPMPTDWTPVPTDDEFVPIDGESIPTDREPVPTDGESQPKDDFGLNFDWYQDAAEIRPLDALVFIGETLTLYCSILESAGDVQAAEVSFVLTPKIGQPWTLNHLVILDNTTAYTNITISESFQKHTTAECMVGTRSLRSTFIYAEKPIQAIRKFKGVYNYQKSIDVTWELGQDYLDDFNLGVEIDWLPYSSPENSSRTLPCSSSTRLSCTIDASDYHSQDVLFFRVKVFSRKLNKRPPAEYLEPLYPTHVTSVHSFLVLENTKPGPPVNVQVINRTSTCFWMTWDNPAYLIHCTFCEKEYEVELVDDWNTSVIKQVKQSLNNTADNNLSVHRVISVCGLKANTKYTVRLRVRDKKSLWSDWATTEAYSEDSRPLSGPKVRSTNYYKGDCHLNKRNVIVYWTTPDRESLGGTLTRFQLNVANKIYSLPPETRSFKLNLSCSHSHSVHIASFTNAGLSLIPSEIYVPKDTEELTAPAISGFKVLEGFNLIVSTSLKNLTVTWDNVDQRDVKLVFYMCQENVETLACYNDYIAMEVDAAVGRIFLTNVPTTQNLLGFALQQADGKKRGIQWASCVYQSDKVPSKPTGVRVAPGNKGGTLVVTWLATPCSRTTKVHIQKYIVYICLSNEFSKSAESCPYTALNAQADSFLAENLQFNTKYVVYMRAAGPEFQGPLSDPISAVTGGEKQKDSTGCSVTEKQMEDENQDKKHIYIGLIVTLVLVLLIIMICVIFWKCRRGY
ncbi:unnamed protein product [Lymnaea stagnalis]|uniref:Fibronectin type-III domain-containing protein n=1 Tax=Lymnaea stagnalis TaxID=6523 RepID=A0AAV2HW84_LYMST